MIAITYSQLRRPEALRAAQAALRINSAEGHRAVTMPGPSLRYAGSGRQERPVGAVSASALVIRSGRSDLGARFGRVSRLVNKRATEGPLSFRLISVTVR